MIQEGLCARCGGAGEVVVYETYFWLQRDMTTKPVRRYPVSVEPCPECTPKGGAS